MKAKSKWSGVVMVLLALVLVLGAALTAAPVREPPTVGAGSLSWGSAEGVAPRGLPPGVGQIIDIAVTGNTVFVLADLDAGVDGNIEVMRSDDGGYSWQAQNVIATLGGAGTSGTAIKVSPIYGSDGTVLVLASDQRVYLSQNRGVTWPFVSLPVGDTVTSLAVEPDFDGLTAGTIAVGVSRLFTTSTVHLNTWSGAPGTWGGWTPLNPGSAYAVGSIAWAVEFAPEAAYSNWVVTVHQIAGSTRGMITTIGGTWPVPAVANLIVAAAPAGAVIAFGDQYNPTVDPNEFFVGLTGAAAGVYWWQPIPVPWENLYAATTVPASRWPTTGLVASGDYDRATLNAGSQSFPLTYEIDVRSGIVEPPVFIEGDGGPIGDVSGTVGVLLAYRGTGNTVFSATADFVGGFTAGDLTGLHRSDNFGVSWFDTALTGEDFRQNVNDMAWLDPNTGVIVNDNGAGIESTFKTWDKGISWKRVDRRQGVTLITRAPDGTIYLLNTGNTADKVQRSTDDGENFTVTATDPSIASRMMTAIAGGSADDVAVGDVNGRFYWSHDGGASWTEAGQLASNVRSMWVPDQYATVNHMAAGVWSLEGRMQVLLSTDRGVSWTQLGDGTTKWGPGLGYIGGAFSPTYETDNLFYAHTMGANKDDVWRTDVSAGAADASWTELSGSGNPISAIDIVHYAPLEGIEAHNGNILYAAVGAPGGVVMQSYQPWLLAKEMPFVTFWNTFPADGASSFVRTGALDAVAGSSVRVFVVDVGAPDRVREFTETTAYLAPATQLGPIDGAIVPSNNTATGEPVELTWGIVVGALTYDVVVATDPSRLFSVLPAITTSPLFQEFSIPVGTLSDGETYYWQLRASSTVNFGYTGPWSDWQSFTVEAVELHMAPTLLSPASGAIDQPIRPLMRWGSVQDATGYLLQVDDDAAFGSPVIDETLGVQQTYQPAADLAWESTYSWRVKAVGADFETAWNES
ncbi:MAG: hypothetical protein ACE5IE_03070, partial [Dehalococcoidia bacterium]